MERIVKEKIYQIINYINGENRMTLESITCPHCGFEFRQDIEIDETVIVRGLFGSSKPKFNTVKSVDLKCPECKKMFEYEV